MMGQDTKIEWVDSTEWGEFRPFGEEYGDTPADAVRYCDTDRWRWIDKEGDSGWTLGCEGRTPIVRVGKKAAGRLLDGRTWDELPTPQPVEAP